jgi:hypothetical protein
VGAGLGGAAIAGGVVALSGGDSGPATTTPATVPPVTLAARRTDTFPFTLSRANLSGSVLAGSVRARAGDVTVTLDFAGDYIILACVGPTSFCIPMGGRPMTTSFNGPVQLPEGIIQAKVYFNTNYPQPQGDPSGTVSFTYNPQ